MCIWNKHFTSCHPREATPYMFKFKTKWILCYSGFNLLNESNMRISYKVTLTEFEITLDSDYLN